MNQQRGRSRKQQVPHRAPMDSGATYKAVVQKSGRKPVKRRRVTSQSDSPTPDPRTTPRSSTHNSPPASPDTPMIDTTTQNSALAKAFSDVEWYMLTQNSSNPPFNASQPHDHIAGAAAAAAATAAATAAAAAGHESLDATAAATAATTGIMSAMQGPTASAAKKRKKPTAGEAAGGSKPGNKRGKGDMKLKPGLCDFCGVRLSKLWRKGPEEYKSLCNSCGLRYTRARKANNLEGCFSDRELAKCLAKQFRGMDEEDADAQEHHPMDDKDSPFYNISNLQGQFNSDPQFDTPSPRHLNSTAAAAAAAAACATPAAKGQRGRPKVVREAAADVFAAAVPADNTGAARATRTRRATEKGAALQETLSFTKCGRSRSSKETAEGSKRGALLDLFAAISGMDDECDAADAADEPFHADAHERDLTSDDYAGHDHDSASEEGDGYGDDHDDASGGGQPGKMNRGPSRLARTTFADEVGKRPARERLSRIETLMMAFAAEIDAIDSAGDNLTEDSNGLSEQPSDAVDNISTGAAGNLQAAARAQANVGESFTAAGQYRPVLMPPGVSSVQFLQSEQQPVPQPQSNQGVQQQQVGMASNLQVAPLAIPPLHTGLIGLLSQQAQVQLQQQHTLQLLIMQQPAAMQMLLQQPALLGPAGILLQGQMMNTGMNHGHQLRTTLMQGVAPANAEDNGVGDTAPY